MRRSRRHRSLLLDVCPLAQPAICIESLRSSHPVKLISAVLPFFTASSNGNHPALGKATAGAFLLLAAMLFLPGCQNYKLGAGADLPFKRIYVAPVVNRSLAPQAQAQVSDQIIRQLMRDSRLTVVSDPAAADAELTVTLVDYQRLVAATSERDTLVGQSFELQLAATATLTNPRDGIDYFNSRPVVAEVNTVAEGGFQANEYQAMTALARDLANRIVTQVTATW